MPPQRGLPTKSLDGSSVLTWEVPEETVWAGPTWVYPEQGLMGDSLRPLEAQTQSGSLQGPCSASL